MSSRAANVCCDGREPSPRKEGCPTLPLLLGLFPEEDDRKSTNLDRTDGDSDQEDSLALKSSSSLLSGYFLLFPLAFNVRFSTGGDIAIIDASSAAIADVEMREDRATLLSSSSSSVVLGVLRNAPRRPFPILDPLFFLLITAFVAAGAASFSDPSE